VGVGSTSITATLNGIHGSTTVTVTAATLTAIAITPPDRSIAKGTSTQLTATCDFSDSTTEPCTSQVSWTSGSNAIAEVSNVPETQGLVTGVGVGSTSITAALDGIQGSTTVTVTPATLTSIVITPPNPSLAAVTSIQLTATGTFSDQTTEDLTHSVSWIALPAGAVTVNQDGLLTGLKAGATGQVTAVQGTVVGSTSVTVTAAVVTSLAITPSDPTLSKAAFPPGFFQQFTATATFSDSSTQDVTTTPPTNWKNDNTTVGLAGPNGKFYPSVPGTTTITATFVDPVTSTTATATTFVTVVP
jgi:hypothetical protein